MFFERDGEHVPISEQSDGLRQLMSMTLFDLAEGTANVVAIDEPELHLHPSSQRTPAELFSDAQIGGKPADVVGTTVFVSDQKLEAEYCAALTGPGVGRALIAAGYCKEAAILSTAAVSAMDDVTSEAMAAYCRKDKVAAVVAIASQLDLATATRITSVHDMITRLLVIGTA